MNGERRVPSNADLLDKLVRIDERLNSHIEIEEPMLMQAKTLLDAHGDAELSRTRIAFINAWMERERQRSALRQAIIEKTTVAALWAVIVYLAFLVKEDLTQLVQNLARR